MTPRFLCLRDLGESALKEVLQVGLEMKRDPQRFENAAHRKGLLLLFEKTSTRTALSYQSAMARLGGYSVVLNWTNSNFAISPASHETQYASRNCDLIMARCKRHETVLELARSSVVPVINGCDDRYHPSQALADFMTMLEVRGSLDGTVVCYVGVRNNVANCLIEGAIMLGVKLLLVTPISNSDAIDADLDLLAASSGRVEYRDDLAAAAAEADFVYTDTWIDMENFADPALHEANRERIRAMTPFQLNDSSLARSKAMIMHDMPIHPGYEITENVVLSDRSIIYQQAENRMHVQQALIVHLLRAERP